MNQRASTQLNAARGCSSAGLDLAENEETNHHHCRGQERAEEKAERRDSIAEVAGEDRLAGGVRRVRDHGESAARDRASDDGVFKRVGKTGTKVAR